MWRSEYRAASLIRPSVERPLTLVSQLVAGGFNTVHRSACRSLLLVRRARLRGANASEVWVTTSSFGPIDLGNYMPVLDESRIGLSQTSARAGPSQTSDRVDMVLAIHVSRIGCPPPAEAAADITASP